MRHRLPRAEVVPRSDGRLRHPERELRLKQRERELRVLHEHLPRLRLVRLDRRGGVERRQLALKGVEDGD
jgi:hypothetical protein